MTFLGDSFELPAPQPDQGCDVAALLFQSGDDLEDLLRAIGQTRALDALHFGTGIRYARVLRSALLVLSASLSPAPGLEALLLRLGYPVSLVP